MNEWGSKAPVVPVVTTMTMRPSCGSPGQSMPMFAPSQSS